jgi:hypothetical protein
MPISSSALAAHLAVTRAEARAAIASTPKASTKATKTHQPGALVVDSVTGQHGKVIDASTRHVLTPRAGQ